MSGINSISREIFKKSEVNYDYAEKVEDIHISINRYYYSIYQVFVYIDSSYANDENYKNAQQEALKGYVINSEHSKVIASAIYWLCCQGHIDHLQRDTFMNEMNDSMRNLRKKADYTDERISDKKRKKVENTAKKLMAVLRPLIKEMKI